MPSNGTVNGSSWEWSTSEDDEEGETHIYVVDAGPVGIDESQYVGTVAVNHTSTDVRVIMDKPCEFVAAESGAWRGGCIESITDTPE